MNVLLINPAVRRKAVYGRFQRSGGVLPPLGLAYIAAVLEKSGHTVSILDGNISRTDKDGVIKNIQRIAPHVIGLTATTLSYLAARDLASEIKKFNKSIHVVIGGPHILGMEREVLNEKCFDSAVAGEGELAMSCLVEKLSKEESLFDVKGLAFRRNNEVIINPDSEPMADIDNLPFPARHLLPSIAEYRPKAISYKKLPSTHIFTSRGCPYKCIFCRTSFGRKVRFHSPEYVIEEITQLVKTYGVQEIIINDDTFIIDRERVFRICELIRRNNVRINWSCNIRANLVDRELLGMMKDSGCWAVALGMESGSQDILNELKKGTTLEQGIQACYYASEAGLSVRPSFILGNPLDTYETIEKTIQLAMSLPVQFPSFSLMTPFPGTEIWERAGEYGSFDHTALDKLSLSSKASFVPDGLSADFLEKKLEEAYRRVYLRPGMIARHLRGIKGPRDIYKMLIAGLELLN